MNALKLPICVLLIYLALLVDTLLLSLLVPEKQITYSFCNASTSKDHQSATLKYYNPMVPLKTGSTHLSLQTPMEGTTSCASIFRLSRSDCFDLIWKKQNKTEMQFISKVWQTEHETQPLENHYPAGWKVFMDVLTLITTPGLQNRATNKSQA